LISATRGSSFFTTRSLLVPNTFLRTLLPIKVSIPSAAHPGRAPSSAHAQNHLSPGKNRRIPSLFYATGLVSAAACPLSGAAPVLNSAPSAVLTLFPDP
jgi:hypothetical protein